MRIHAALGAALAVLLACSGAAVAAQEAPGADLAERLGCFACHSVKGQGGNGAVSLDGVATRLSPRQLQLALTYPRQLHPRAKMPSYAYLPTAEQEALVHYLESFK
ncbi:MAG: cytochrome c [Syntrophobacterales bacterium]|nr:cytochrome c [Syntrophobacterales bacterium]